MPQEREIIVYDRYDSMKGLEKMSIESLGFDVFEAESFDDVGARLEESYNRERYRNPDAVIAGTKGIWSDSTGKYSGLEFVEQRADDYEETAFGILSNLDPAMMDIEMKEIRGLDSYRIKDKIDVSPVSRSFEEWVENLLSISEVKRRPGSFQKGELEEIKATIETVDSYFQENNDKATVWHAI